MALWAVYYTIVFTVGRFGEITQLVIWAGGALVAFLSLRQVLRNIRRLPKEVFLLAAFLAWSAFGGLMVQDFSGYLVYVKHALELLAMIAVLGTVLRTSGQPDSFWWAFVATAVFNAAALFSGENQMGALQILSQRQRGLIDNANGLAFLCFLGVFGTVALLGERVSKVGRTIALIAAVPSVVGIVAAGSRGAFLSFVLLLFLWPLMCIPARRRSRGKMFLASAVVVFALFYVVDWIQTETVLGKRTSAVFSGEDTSVARRLQLALTGVRIGLENPIFGVGLGNFGIASGMGQYAHNEFVEVFATTGFPGLAMVAALYWLAWRRLGRAGKVLADPVIRYRVNMFRVLVIILVVAGAVFRPNIVHVDTIFLISLAVGYSHWAADRAREAVRVTDRNRKVVAPGPPPLLASLRMPGALRGFRNGMLR